MAKLVECVPNFSEGQRREVIEAIVGTARETPGSLQRFCCRKRIRYY